VIARPDSLPDLAPDLDGPTETDAAMDRDSTSGPDSMMDLPILDGAMDLGGPDTRSDAPPDARPDAPQDGVVMSAIEAGVPPGEDLTRWQSGDSPTANGSERWFCNAGQPVTGPGVLTSWSVFVHASGSAGEVAQLIVIRCTGGGAGSSGPVLSGCRRVAFGPVQSIAGDGLSVFTLAASTQLDGAVPSPMGIRVRMGDFICADSNEYDIGVDCNGDASSGGCPGAAFANQRQFDLDTLAEPFSMTDPQSEGVLMIRAIGTGPG